MGIPSLITSDNFNSLGNDVNIVGTFSSTNPIPNSDKYVSPILLNYVEPYDYNGVSKTLFYTEVNTNLKVGDRVFIINGNYDSNKLIQANKYKKGRDGYKILSIDYCKIVLDIDYTGTLPTNGNSANGDNMSDYIKVYYIDSYDSFLTANKQLSTRGGNFSHKFDYQQNNIAFIDSNYLPINDNWTISAGITASPGFYVKNPTQSNWSNITNEFINSGSYSLALAPSYNFYNNGKLKVMGKSFTYNGFEFKDSFVYHWNATYSTWEVDITEESTAAKAIISKSNFIDGNFTGSFNSGVYGSKIKKIEWTGDGIWNGGTLLNSRWKTGALNSNILLDVSYKTTFDKYGNPYQKANSYNNGGYGFNYIIESEFETSSIYSSIIRNTIFGSTPSLMVVENHINNNVQNFDTTISNGLFENCEFNNVYLIGGSIKNSRSSNSKFSNVKIINSFIKDSVITNSTIISESAIKIDSYDEWNASERRIQTGLSANIDFKVYKFYIGEADFLKFRQGDSFYIKGLNINDNSKDVLKFFDKKFRLGNWIEYIDDLSDNTITPLNILSNTFYKRGIECAAFLCTPEENDWIYNSTATQSGGPYYTEAVLDNSNKKYSIDIFISRKDIYGNDIDGLDFNYGATYSDTSTLGLPDIINNNLIDVTNAYIIDSNIESGLIENSDWNSGYNINYSNDNLISPFNTTSTIYSMTFSSQGELIVNTPGVQTKPEVLDPSSKTPNISDIKVGDILFLGPVDYILNDNTTRLPDTYKVTKKSPNYITLVELGTYSVISGLNIGGTFSTLNTENRYNYLSKVKINNTKIKSGLFKRSYIVNSLIKDDTYDTTDMDYNNMDKIRNLVISDSIFSNTNNILSKATYLNSTFVNGSDIWDNGIIQNSILNGITFNNGIIKESAWLDGIFNGGIFYKSRSYDTDPSNDYPGYNDDIETSYYKDGLAPYNNRYSWRNGIFNGGQFFKSEWEDGIFNDGLFYNSRFFGGTVSGGIIGNDTTPDTYIYNGTITYTTVNNANVYATNSNTINWLNGIFNKGIFGAATNSNAIWNDGTFNGGQFTDNASWLNGTFNGGNFTSIYACDTVGYNIISNTYSWMNGTFNGGVFGNGSTSSNSTWGNGDFEGGIFNGKLWANGIFKSGQFNGSGLTAVGVNPLDATTNSNSQAFIDNFKNNGFYGLWLDGVVTNQKDVYVTDKKFYTDITRSVNDAPTNLSVSFNNTIWMSGEFNHPEGNITNSVWLDGAFKSGNFIQSSFNPYIDGNFNTYSTCYWDNGVFTDSEFFYSDWNDGKFISGTAVGMVFNNGTSYYMNAYNIAWNNGTWKNGNWNGSIFNYNGSINNDYVIKVLNRINDVNGTQSLHIWNIFEDIINSNTLITEDSANVAIDTAVPGVPTPDYSSANSFFPPIIL